MRSLRMWVCIFHFACKMLLKDQEDGDRVFAREHRLAVRSAACPCRLSNFSNTSDELYTCVCGSREARTARTMPGLPVLKMELPPPLKNYGNLC